MEDRRPSEGYTARSILPVSSSSSPSHAESSRRPRSPRSQYEAEHRRGVEGYRGAEGSQVYQSRNQYRPDPYSYTWAGPSRQPEHGQGPPAHRYIDSSAHSSRASTEERQFAYSNEAEFHRTIINTSSGRNPSVPPAQRTTPHVLPTPLPSSRPPPSPPASRGTYPQYPTPYHQQTLPILRQSNYVQDERPGPDRLLSPPSSRGDTHMMPATSTHRPGSALRAIERSQSESSRQSGYSAQQAGRLSRTPPSTGSVQGDDDVEIDGPSRDPSNPDPPGSVPLPRPKRTRVLMTHNQQNLLGVLWRRSKFPSTQEREEIAIEVGLSPRQVQVWFQNRRQTFRKQIQQNAIPQGSDPADYSDLQKSPRSRRLSLEAANAAAASDDRDRVSQWAESSSVSSQSYASRSHSGAYAGIPPSRDASEHPVLPRFDSSSASSFAHSPPSPPRKPYEGDFRQLPHWSRSDALPYRPSTAISTASFADSMSSLPGSSRRPWSQGPMASSMDQAHSFRDTYSSRGIASAVPYSSPPPTAESLPATLSMGYPNKYADGHKRMRIESAETPVSLPDGTRHSTSPERPKPSHLPPSLAALAITRPLGQAGIPRASNTLPSLGMTIDLSDPATSSPAMGRIGGPLEQKGAVEWEPGQGGGKDGAITPQGDLLRPKEQMSIPPSRIASAEGARSTGGPETVELGETKSAPAALPRFNDLFR